MPGYDKRSLEHQTTNLFFIHNCFGSFFSGVLNWFADDFYPRFNYKVIGTYDKACEFFKKKKELGTEVTTNLLPSITLDPTLDFSNAEQGGKFLWQYSRYAPAIGLRLWKSVDIKEQDVVVTPVFSRYQGTFEVIFWLSSVYELMDFRVALLQFCGGFNRWCRPEYFWTYLILPETVSDYQKDDGTKLDWGNTLADVIHVQTINKHQRVIPITLDPMWKLESFSDASTKYGGDQIAEYKLTASFAYEVNLPTYIVVSENIDPTINLQLSLGSTYSKYPLVSPYKVLQFIADSDDRDKFFGKYFSFYRIEDQIAEQRNLVVEFSVNSVYYPHKIEEWNHIVSGRLIHLTDEWISDPLNKVRRENIVIMDQYKEEYLPYLRRACGVISRRDTGSSKFFNKCELMKKPCVCFITDEEWDSIIGYEGELITLDSRQRRFYTGQLEVIAVTNEDAVSSFKALEDIKERDPEAYEKALKKARDGVFPFDVPDHIAAENVNKMQKRLVSDFTDGIQTDFQLSYIIDNSNRLGLQIYLNDKLLSQGSDYELINGSVIRFPVAPERGSNIWIGGEFLVIKESKLVGIYEFTDTDLEQIDEFIKADLPEPLDSIDNAVLVSYGGKLDYEKDYVIDIEKSEVTIKIPPLVGEIIQFFYYV